MSTLPQWQPENWSLDPRGVMSGRDHFPIDGPTVSVPPVGVGWGMGQPPAEILYFSAGVARSSQPWSQLSPQGPGCLGPVPTPAILSTQA